MTWDDIHPEDLPADVLELVEKIRPLGVVAMAEASVAVWRKHDVETAQKFLLYMDQLADA